MNHNYEWGQAIQTGEYSLESDLRKKGMIAKHVFWLGKQRSGVKKQATRILTVAEGVLLTASVIGAPIVFKAVKVAKKKRKYEKFRLEILQKEPPPKELNIQLKGNLLETFNHAKQYAIKDEVIWSRTLNEVEEPWEALFFDGFPKRKPVEIYADGGNLIVVDDRNQIHYKKVLKETLHIFEKEAFKSKPPSANKEGETANSLAKYRIKNDFIWVKYLNPPNAKWQPLYFEGWPDKKPISVDVSDNVLSVIDDNQNVHQIDVSEESLKQILENQNYPFAYFYTYSALTKDAKDNWKDRWFTLPYLNGIVNFFTGKRLTIPEGAQIAISNRGAFTGYWRDSAGTEHPDYIAVTTLYALFKGEEGEFIRFADPWLPFGFGLKSFPFVRDKKIELPTGFVVNKFRASASAMIVLGKYENEERVTLLVRIADFDTEKINPFLPYGDEEVVANTEEKNEINDNLRILPKNYHDIPPDQLWSKISLEGLSEEELDFNTITILQIGLGNDSKEIRIGSTKHNGFYSKTLVQVDAPWIFVKQ